MNASVEHAVIGITVAQHRAPAQTARKIGCSVCAMRSLCMPTHLKPEELCRLEAIVSSRRLVRRGEVLFRTGDEFQSLYAVRSGSFKSAIVHRDGAQQVTGLHLPGDPLGLDGVSEGHHTCEAVALEDSSVCVIPFGLFEEFCHDVRPMQRHFYRMMGRVISNESDLLVLLGTMSAEQRVAAFLLNVSERFRDRGFSPTSFSIRMTREELGNYLGLKLETVSRMLSKLQASGLIETHGKSFTLLDPEALASV
jgi:CRP/FNR family transcriptional regulator